MFVVDDMGDEMHRSRVLLLMILGEMTCCRNKVDYRIEDRVFPAPMFFLPGSKCYYSEQLCNVRSQTPTCQFI